MLIREKSIKDEYRELVEAERAKKEAIKEPPETIETVTAKPKKGKAKKVGVLKTKKK